jgi:type IV pilus assembly protein PilE
MRHRGSLGFTLIEIMVAVVLVAILAAIAIPSYSAYVVRGQRAAAKAALEQAAQFLERNYTTSGCYNFTDAASCAAQGGNAVTAIWTFTGAPTDGGGTFTYAIGAPNFTPPAGFVAGQYFSVTATPCAGSCTGGNNFTDSDCGALTLDNTGTKSANGTIGTAKPELCWGR